MSIQFQVEGAVADALFSLKIHRGEGMALLAMNWKQGRPPIDFVGFAIEYREPDGTKFFPLKNRLTFEGNAGSTPSGSRPPTYSTLVAPIQKFRWVHFARNAELDGAFSYRVKPVFMNPAGDLSYGVAQTADLALARETIPNALNVAFTRGFISSQAFVDRYLDDGAIDTLLPGTAAKGLDFHPTHKDAADAYNWMGFEARREVLALLDAAIADGTAHVGIVAFDFNLPELMQRIETLGDRLRIIIDDSKDHHGDSAAEDQAEERLKAAGIQVRRQHMRSLQHNKTIVVKGNVVRRVLCGSTNMSWRGFYAQNNNALVVEGDAAVDAVQAAFDTYWDDPGDFPKSASAGWTDLGIAGVDATVAFSPHSAKNSVLQDIANDIASAESSLFYSLAFLNITPGVIRNAVASKTASEQVFVAGISDKRTGVEVTVGSSNLPPTYVAALDKNAPSPFRQEPTGLTGSGGGTRMHHKFIVIDFATDEARVYLGSYNMSKAADSQNGENLVLIRDRRVATAYMIEAVRIIDHYQFRVARQAVKKKGATLKLQKPPVEGETPWWAEDYEDPRKIKDRELFA
jgi:hypothetical protein